MCRAVGECKVNLSLLIRYCRDSKTYLGDLHGRSCPSTCIAFYCEGLVEQHEQRGTVDAD